MSRVITLFFVAAACMSAASVYSAPTDAETQKILTKLGKTWEFQKNEIATAHITFRWSYGQRAGKPFCKELTSEQVHEIVNSVDYSDPQKAFDELSEKLHIEQPIISATELFYTHTPMRSRQQLKVHEQMRDKVRPGFDDYIRVFDGKNSIIVDPLNNQVDVTADYSGCFLVSRLRFDLSSFNQPAIRNQFSFTVNSGHMEALLNNKEEVTSGVIDIETGLLLFYSTHFKEYNQIGRDIYQRCFFTSPGGIVFPRLYLDINYTESKTRLIEIYMIDEAVFNQPLSDDLFAVSLPQGTHVWDRRYSNDRGQQFTKLQEKTDDVIKNVIGDYVDTNVQDVQQKPGLSHRWAVLLIANTLVLLLIVWAVFFKKRS
ncbi:hypothetical protein FACS189419_02030 [Planctomycetales bacterium]|nr:hypothetical protein FACS189419_02030 [Planctomycetales bacterium]